MVPISNVFGERGPETSDNGYLHTLSDGNMAADGVVTFVSAGTHGEGGSIGEMYDGSPDTWYALTHGVFVGTGEGTITIDLGKKVTNATLTAYFSVQCAGTGNYTATLQTSEDDTTYSDLASITRGTAGETFKNHSSKETLRYVRLKFKQNSGSDSGEGRCRALTVAKK